MESSKASVGTVANRGTNYLTSGRVGKINTSVQHGTTKIKKKAWQKKVKTKMKDHQVNNFTNGYGQRGHVI